MLMYCLRSACPVRSNWSFWPQLWHWQSPSYWSLCQCYCQPPNTCTYFAGVSSVVDYSKLSWFSQWSACSLYHCRERYHSHQDVTAVLLSYHIFGYLSVGLRWSPKYKFLVRSHPYVQFTLLQLASLEASLQEGQSCPTYVCPQGLPMCLLVCVTGQQPCSFPCLFGMFIS